MTRKSRLLAAAFAVTVTAGNLLASASALAATHPVLTTPVAATQVRYGTVNVDGLNIAYREAGDPKSPKLVLLHGWPSSSHQYRDLIVALAPRFHVIAPDYQGFGNSDAPDPARYHYSFDAISVTVEKFLAAKGFDHYGVFMQDYGGPVGYRIMGRNPQALDWVIIQNTNAYENGFTPAWDGFRKALWVDRNAASEAPLAAFNTPDGIKGVYLTGAGHPELIAPESYQSDAAFVARPNNLRIQLDLFYDYRNNVALYPTWQKFLREHQPKTLIFWGEHDPFFTPEGGESYLKDLPRAEIHRLNAGHFATEDNLPFIASHIISFYDKQVKRAK
ncbi:alpha/beta hydrolase [Sphingomonas sp. RT2P30]|uniref:alpha/beta fold hydrolase n=1 Tax=Parasphingomonas halimpatiens TaxID=3096162 RepID=UPI002FC7EF2B